MSWDRRLKMQVESFSRRILCCKTKKIPEEGLDEENGEGNKQYCLETTNATQSNGIFRSLTACLCGAAVGSGRSGIGLNHNQCLASSLHWMFRVNFIFLFAVMCTIFFLLVIIFAGIIIAVGHIDDQCIQVGGTAFGNSTSEFADAFALSWTTFSTVGYGSTYPALGHENDGNPTNCLLITIVSALESFLGVLYSGFCGAILFGKGTPYSILRFVQEGYGGNNPTYW